ncbi:hypothetical protein FHS29_002389 [Saccharothrix tamanrassetensis]|uniref:DUF397 domain-containing protein n=1 Tax=Saccharothrix tamanrassetensis TaxID=1051531 RepID=A0A841CHY8_9PSEU|nr:DUF397 domain-containing protein [Saccharothrix tamanrassetensis]MBB5955808.1 hypothetical protein [Saccharothrix tamanrassetensis]
MFRRSSYSGMDGNNCVEVARLAAVVAVRDSKAPEGGQVALSPAGFGRFLTAAKGDRLSRS